MNKPLLSLGIAVLTIVNCATAQLSLQKFEINPSGDAEILSPLAFNGKVYFYANDGINGLELWSCNGISTSLIKDIYPGTTGCLPNPAYYYARSKFLCELNGKLYFTAGNATTGAELYEYDGTNPPAIVKDVKTGPGHGLPDQLTALNGVLYFSAETSNPGMRELWSYTPSSNDLKKLSGPPNIYLNVRTITAYNGKVYMSAQLTSGNELYVYDPSNGNIALVADIEPGSVSSDPRAFGELNGKLYFIANTQADGAEIYSYNGSNTPVIVTQLQPGTKSSVESNLDNKAMLNVSDGKLVFGGLPTINSFEFYTYDPLTQQSSGTSVGSSMIGALTDFFSYGQYCYFSELPIIQQSDLYRFSHKTKQVEKLTSTHPAFMNIHSVYDATPLGNDMYVIADTDPSNNGYDFELFKFTDSSLSISEVISSETIKIYPNPATGNVSVALPQQLSNLEVVLTDMKGSVVYRNAIAAAQTIAIPMQQLQAAIYICSVKQDGKEIFSGQVVKQ